ncbi:Lhr family ATP-dependent helicase [Gryllotalpicola ginsengisoli]|uniref:Lhr family ATP-dependent helicase n=1 Tax=Gryllotalpicola ginsengisoli TaxID=444608 RepID=UPI0003B41FB6|nr:crosslink repair DNA glycosylase YcaQ family protein [Gryllotalpicola ginsengisoli]
MGDALERFSAPTREWFGGAFSAPTDAQLGAWEAISSGRNTLVIAPTGSGKTLAAFLWAIDRLMSDQALTDAVRARTAKTRVLYISPLKALGVDVERNLRSPLVGIAQTAKRLGLDAPDVSVGVRSGDTPAGERRRLLTHPPEILITTPESLYLMLTSGARETLDQVETVIVDEVHAVASTKRGAHLAVSLERLDALLPKPAQRIGLSATVRPPEEVARFLSGSTPTTIVAPASHKRWDLRVVVPVDDMRELQSGPDSDKQGGTMWTHVDEAVLDEVLAHRSTIVFANGRRTTERLTARLNELYAERLGFPAEAPTSFPAQLVGSSGTTGAVATEAPVLARAHHGSVSKEQRAAIEDDLKTGRLRCVVATSSLELGIDMGEVDLVVQVAAPPSVASGLQRIGRAGHQVGEVSKGVIFPNHRADLVQSALATERMRAGLIEQIRVPQNPLDILAQQTVAAVSVGPVDVDGWFDTVRRAAPFATLPRSAYEATLDLLSGRYPSEEFGELRPRVVWDRERGVLTSRPGASRLAVTSGGTIPDRGYFGVFMVGDENGIARRVGELDEEMVYESRVGDVFALGTTSWRIQEITHDRVMVTPEYGAPGRVPFWHGDAIGRPAELGEALGVFTRELGTAIETDAASRLRSDGLDERAVRNLLTYLADQKTATGHLPTDKTLVVERFRDELGDWRIVLHSPYGMTVHAPWALAVGQRVRERLGLEASALAADDGIIVRLPDSDAEPPGAELFAFSPDELEQLVTEEVGGSALFAARFREAAQRALLFPRYDPGRRMPLWQQRMRSAQLLEVAQKYPQFPIILETMRECLQDVYDLPALRDIAKRIEQRRIRLVETTTDRPSPYASTLLFGYIAAFMYEGDAPLAERRAAALTVDTELLAELLGRSELRELLDPAVIERVERELQRLPEDRHARGLEGVADLLRILGPLSTEELAARFAGDEAELTSHLDELVRAKRALRVAWPGRLGGARGGDPAKASAQNTQNTNFSHSQGRDAQNTDFSHAWAAIEDAPRLRDALGVPLPIGVPVAFVEPVADPLGDLVGRYARTHGPFSAAEVAARFGLGEAVVADALRRLAHERRVTEGEFRPHTTGVEWCDSEVLRRLRRLSLAALRHEVEPVEPAAYARFLPDWQHVGTSVFGSVDGENAGSPGGDRRTINTSSLKGVDGVASVIEQLAGVRVPASAWETLVLPARVPDYRPAMLDELTASGEVVWAGAGTIPGRDGWLSLHLADSAAVTLAAPIDFETDALQREILTTLGAGGGFFFRQLSDAVGSQDDAALETALWDLVWAGLVTNDTLAPVRALTGGKAAHRRPRTAPRSRMFRGGRVQLAAATMSRPAAPTRTGPPTVAGRWSLLPLGTADATLRAHAAAETLLDRYGVVTRGSVQNEGLPGGFALAYRVLSEFENTGQVRRGYFIETLGAAQFASAPTVDRLRGFTLDETAPPPLSTVTLAATDPANPYGAALPWPDPPAGENGAATGHRPGRKAGGLVTLVDGRLVLYIERGGKTVLAFSDDPAVLAAAAASVAQLVRRGGAEKLAVELVNGAFVIGTPLGDALTAAGFTETPRGLRLRY